MSRTSSELNCASSAVREMKSTARPPVIGMPAGKRGDTAAGIFLGCHCRAAVRQRAGHFQFVQFFVGFLRRPAGHEPVVLRIVETDALRRLGKKRLRQLAADGHAHGRVCAGAGVVEVAAEPAVFFNPSPSRWRSARFPWSGNASGSGSDNRRLARRRDCRHRKDS